MLKEIYAKYLKDIGVKNENILIIELDDILNYKYRNPIRLMEYVQGLISHLSDDVYVFIDEIQLITKIINPELTGGEIKKAKETDEDTIWLYIYSKGFMYYESCYPDDTEEERKGYKEKKHFYLPTQKRLDEANGEDWY